MKKQLIPLVGILLLLALAVSACAPAANALCLLGSRFSVKLSARVTVLGTGNNLELVGDLTRLRTRFAPARACPGCCSGYRRRS